MHHLDKFFIPKNFIRNESGLDVYDMKPKWGRHDLIEFQKEIASLPEFEWLNIDFLLHIFEH